MMNLTNSNFFRLLHDENSSEQELRQELNLLLGELVHYYSSWDEVHCSIREIQKTLASLTLLKSELKSSKHIRGEYEVRVHYVKALDHFLNFELSLIKCILRKGFHISSKSEYKWTSTISDFVELTYSLIETKVIDNGNIQIEKFVQELGKFFGLEIKNSSRIFTNIKQRKSRSRTAFLDTLSESLNRRMIEDDEK